MKRIFPILFFLSLAIYSFSVNLQQSDIKKDIPQFLHDTSGWVDSVFNSLTPKERIAQLIMVPFYPNKDTANQNQTIRQIKKYNPGGVIIFQGSLVKTARQLNRINDNAKTPLIVALDGEWGLSMRIDSTLVYPKQMMLGALSDNKLIYQMGVDIAQQLKRMGMHTNFAPVVDVNNNSKNPVINGRSFGQDREKVLEKGTAYMMALQDNHIIATAKHFPGHGDTETDSHYSLPLLPYSTQRLDSLELYPFKNLINKGLMGVMVAHLNIPALDSSGVPSTLSNEIIDSLLKKQLGFNGLIFTDALNMKGVSTYGSPTQVAIKAFKAGNDVLLMPEDVGAVIEALKTAADSSVISYDEINKRCKKILQTKHWLGANNYQPVSTQNLYNDLNLPSYDLTRRNLIENAITVIKNDDYILPLKRLDTLRIASISVGDSILSVFQSRLDNYAPMDHYFIHRDAKIQQFDSIRRILKKYNLVIAGLLNTDMRVTKKYGVNEVEIDFLQRLADSSNVILDIFASPYVLNRFVPTNKYKAIIMSYEDKELNQDLSAQLIFGGIVPKGKLPVDGSSEYAINTGITWDNPVRFKYTIPEELGIPRTDLDSIDQIVKEAITKKALPGGVVFLAKDGKVFYHKAFGHHTYDSARTTLTSDIYDLASITKIAATTVSLMKLSENKQLSINSRLAHYIPELKPHHKGKISVKDVLSHQGRFPSWSPFYLKTIQCDTPGEKLYTNLPTNKNSYKVNETTYVNCHTTYINGIYSKNAISGFNTKVADSLYIIDSYKDTIFNRILDIDLLPKPVYLYSDLGFILLDKAIQNITHSTLDRISDSLFYKPLGAKTLVFNPLYKFSRKRITPCENDIIWRKQVVHGYVHDPAAAMLGGVSGNAGLFGNANDLAILMQMLLNKGEYGGIKYLDHSTIDHFNTRYFYKNANRRGLGFDKPEPDPKKGSPVSRYVSDNSFGHSGFTGTLTWVDPDNGLVYVFLSNRVYPEAWHNKLAELNVRTNIQDIIYRAFQRAK